MKGLYLITDQKEQLMERVESALSGGVACLQYRDKTGDAAARRAQGERLRSLCLQKGIPFIVNDDVRLAAELRADGVHLGQDDGEVAGARLALGHDAIIGVSTHSVAEAVRAEADGADYIGFGAMYPTGSKDVRFLPGPDILAQARKRVRIPMVAIGGVNRDNAARVIDAGADAVAVISAVLSHPEPGLAAAELALLFNRRLPFPRGSTLTVAGSDSGGGAGIQADIKTITLLGGYAASVITALTAQNTLGVAAIHGVPAPFVAEQLEAVLSDIPVDVVKTGMLFSAPIIRVLAEKLAAYDKKMLVLDPVMIAKGGSSLVDDHAVEALVELMLPKAYLVTPNVPEAERLTGLAIGDRESGEEACRRLRALGARNVLLKGGHLPGPEASDLLFDGATFSLFATPRIETANTHGTGCSLASAVSAFLAGGEPLPLAVAKAKEFITTAISLAVPLGRGHGPVNHFLAARGMVPD
jgi:hydroxymethylpyrimidine kinase/phosphomethylpyrimidine kinase/thiamine-phosphate diphosphorylase